MKNSFKLLAFSLVLVLIVLACSLPGSANNDGNNSNNGSDNNSGNNSGNGNSNNSGGDQPTVDTDTPIPPPPSPDDTATATTAPTDTPVPSATTVCDLVQFVTDVTVPDGTKADPGQNFSKTWRLRNAGSCTWTSGYDLVFHSGDQMSAPAAVQLTSGTVAPGGEVDVSVSLTAPTSPGTYKGFFKLRNGSGNVFGMPGPFWVEIKVKSPPAPSSTTVTIAASADGSVRSNGQIIAHPNVGDAANNAGSQGFLQFDISGIPAGATITDLEFIVVSYDILDDPFGDLGYLRIYDDPGPFFPLDAGDYANTLGALKSWSSEGALSDTSAPSYFISALQSAIGGSTFELRLHFNTTETDNDNADDMVRFGIVKLKITYTTP